MYSGTWIVPPRRRPDGCRRVPSPAGVLPKVPSARDPSASGRDDSDCDESLLRMARWAGYHQELLGGGSEWYLKGTCGVSEGDLIYLQGNCRYSAKDPSTKDPSASGRWLWSRFFIVVTLPNACIHNDDDDDDDDDGDDDIYLCTELKVLPLTMYPPHI